MSDLFGKPFWRVLMSSSVALLFACAALPLVAGEPDEDEEQRSERRPAAATDLGSYRVGSPGSSSRFRSTSRDRDELERPEIDRESLRMERGSFSMEPARGASSGMDLQMDIRPSRRDRGDRRVVEEEDREVESASEVSGDRDLIPVRIEAPRYPRNAYRNRIEGHATVQFVVGTDGQTRDVRVLESSPRSVFDRSARDAVERWEFEPRVVNGRAVEMQLTQTIDFTIDD